MDFTETVFLVMGPLIVSFILFAATINGWAWNSKIGYGLAAIFLLIGVSLAVALYVNAEILVVAIISVPFGGFVTIMGFGMIIDVFRYRQKNEGMFNGTEFAHYAKGNIVYHSLIFTYSVDGKIYQYSSDDYYRPKYIKKHFDTRKTYRIWVNPGKPDKFRVKRFYRLAEGIFAALLGLSFLWIPFDMLLSRI